MCGLERPEVTVVKLARSNNVDPSAPFAAGFEESMEDKGRQWPLVSNSFLLLLVRHLLLEAMHLFLVANIVTISKAKVYTKVIYVACSEFR